MFAVINFALSCRSACIYQLQENLEQLTLLLCLINLTVYLLSFFFSCPLPCSVPRIWINIVHIHILGGWKAVYHAKREHQRLRGEVAKKGQAIRRDIWVNHIRILKIKCELMILWHTWRWKKQTLSRQELITVQNNIFQVTVTDM